MTRKPRESSQVVARIVRTVPLAEATAAEPPAPVAIRADVLNVSRLLCPACRRSLRTYSTKVRQTVIVRLHQCRHCGATALRTHEVAGVIQFVGWAGRTLPQFSRN